MVNVKRVQLTPQQDGSVQAEVTVKILFFDRTERFTLPARPPVVTASAADGVRPEIRGGSRTPSESIGVIGALGR